MQLTPYVEELRAGLRVAAESGSAEATEAAERLIAAVDATARLVLLEALSDAAAEVTRDLAPTSVAVTLRGLDPEFVVTAPAADASEPAVATLATPATVADTDEGTTARTTLRLPEQLKLRVEDAAAREGVSVNAWLVRAVTQALGQGGFGRATPPTGQRFTGWAH